MTNTALKAQIDTDITNKTATNSITPANVGSNMKEVVNYVDQQTSGATKVVKTVLTPSQVNALFDTPITVLDSSAIGVVRLPINIWVKRNAGTAYTLATSSFSVINDTGATVTGNINPNPLTGTTDGFFTAALTNTQNSSGTDKNLLYKLKANTGNPSGGTGNLDVYVTYIEITLT